jgi:hypothetical protein
MIEIPIIKVHLGQERNSFGKEEGKRKNTIWLSGAKLLVLNQKEVWGPKT